MARVEAVEARKQITLWSQESKHHLIEAINFVIKFNKLVDMSSSNHV